MLEKIRHRYDLLALLLYSYLSLVLLVAISFYSPMMDEPSILRKPIIGSVFGLICFLGMIAALLPTQCSQIFFIKNKKDIETSRSRQHQRSGKYINSFRLFGLNFIHGHHPDCERFSTHELRIKTRTFCAGCSGMFLGALISLVGVIIYSTTVVSVLSSLIILGFLGVSLGLLLTIPDFPSGFLRFFLNAFFIIGMFLLLIAVDSITMNFFIDLLLVSFSIFWLFTRISFSKWNHSRICNNCGDKCKLGYLSE